ILRLLLGRPAPERTATFRCLLLYVDPAGRRHGFPGACMGQITEAPRGPGGFGFDPVFIPQGEARTFAEMGEGEKRAVSHRGKAARALAAHLEKAAKR
ncbi:MAG TPA: non-canonical purine NTP pyrophosphatase, partial [Candidatus Thermoplasmatota archaeon]|nr:non-canonical purine NTP pyrophosphatase [Candidatus Thermoplasmatota archaeon]